MDKFTERMKRHDEFENEVMDIIRPYTTRRHLPDRFVSFKNKIYAWDAKTSIFVEDKSYDEYFRLYEENGIPQWVIWRKELSEEEVRRRYFEMTGREPNRIHSPEESATDWWWTGWVSKKEYYEYDKRRKQNERENLFN